MGPLSLQLFGDIDRPYSTIEVIADDRIILDITTDVEKRPHVALGLVKGKGLVPVEVVAGLLQDVLNAWRRMIETTDHARLHAARGADPAADWVGLNLRTLDELTAFDAVRAFLEGRSRSSGASITDLLVDLDRTGWSSGMPIDPETWPEWRRAVDAVLSSD
ncbi:hypothetical protein [Sphingomonas sp.]|jgi:hypothetical protein|uniref:hypothetical protein n=1 Tax=Sphingomonas sp. TaxID=28214 RepID=UPI002D7F5683|nr:hypothetical protein [Sphingomonas sp.]HEU0043370.1 hypothetical protein [Sphingomonas sp.]